MAKLLGIDYGEKRIGLAISDENGVLAFPIEVLENNKNILEEMAKILKENQVSKIVIGDSKDQNGAPNPIAGEIENFIIVLQKKFSIQVERQAEFFTSFESMRREGKGRNNARKIKRIFEKKDDAKAAALILQRYLDRTNRN